jgi:beta-phosphoglucomutase-like phosphatase (HAD superfamily)
LTEFETPAEKGLEGRILECRTDDVGGSATAEPAAWWGGPGSPREWARSEWVSDRGRRPDRHRRPRASVLAIGAFSLIRSGATKTLIPSAMTSGRRPEIDASLDALGVPPEMVVVDRGAVVRAKPEPDLFLACQERLGAAIRDCYVIGDAVWDLLAARRAGMLSVGVLTGGYGEDELLGAGAFRVYRGTDELLASIDELGI